MTISPHEQFWRVRLRVEVSARYHEWRRSSLSTTASAVKFISLIGSLLAFFAVTRWVETSAFAVGIVVALTLAIARNNALDLCFWH